MSFEPEEEDQFGQSYDENNYQKNATFDDECPVEYEFKPRVVIMGMRRSGKTSIENVVFHKMAPNETIFLGSTTKVKKREVSSSPLVSFQIWDVPTKSDVLESDEECESMFGGCGAVVFVIDAQDDHSSALNKLHTTIVKAHKICPNIKFEIFIHKIDGLTEDVKIETQRDIHRRSTDDLAYAGLGQINLSFHLTSIYDHSAFEAFSKVLQKLNPELPNLENALNDFILRSGIEKAFLFDVASKIYIATDPNPVDMQSYELCCDMIDVVIDLSGIYGVEQGSETGSFDDRSSCIIKLNNGTVLYLREVNQFLALICMIRIENFDKQGAIDYNFLCFRKALNQFFRFCEKEKEVDCNSEEKPLNNSVESKRDLENEEVPKDKPFNSSDSATEPPSPY